MGILVFGLLHGATLVHLPDISGDEVDEIHYAAVLAKTGTAKYETLDNMYSPRFAFLSHAFPTAIRQIYTACLAGVFRGLGTGLWQARLMSLSAAIAILVLLYFFARRYIGAAGALAGVLFLTVQPVFGLGAHIARPAMLLGAFVFGAFVLVWLAFNTGRPRLGALGAFLGALSLGVHPNGLVFCLGIGAMAVTFCVRQNPGWGAAVFYCGLGGLVGGAVWALTAGWEEFIVGWIAWRGYLVYEMPLLSGQNALLHLFQEAARFFAPGPVYQTAATPFYALGMRIEGALLFLAVAGLVPAARTQRDARAILTLNAVVFVGLALIVSHKDPGYRAAVLPFLALALAKTVQNLTDAAVFSGRMARAALGGVGTLFFLTSANGMVYQAANHRRPTHYDDVCRELQAASAPSSRVMGPGQYWLCWATPQFLDSNALVFEHWLTASARHVPDTLQRVRPAYLIVDPGLGKILGAVDRRSLQRVSSATHVGTVQKPLHPRLDILRLAYQPDTGAPPAR